LQTFKPKENTDASSVHFRMYRSKDMKRRPAATFMLAGTD